MQIVDSFKACIVAHQGRYCIRICRDCLVLHVGCFFPTSAPTYTLSCTQSIFQYTLISSKFELISLRHLRPSHLISTNTAPAQSFSPKTEPTSSPNHSIGPRVLQPQRHSFTNKSKANGRGRWRAVTTNGIPSYEFVSVS